MKIPFPKWQKNNNQSTVEWVSDANVCVRGLQTLKQSSIYLLVDKLHGCNLINTKLGKELKKEHSDYFR